MALRTINRLTALCILAFGLSSCYYDNEEELYPGSGACNTENVSYSADIAPVLATYCDGCHSGASPQNGLRTDNHADLLLIVNDGRFAGSVNHQSGYSPMPKGGNQLNSCQLARINAWIAQGALNN